MMEKGDLEDLQNDIWNNNPVPAYLKIENKTYDVDISYRGSYTREFPKKSYWVQFINPRIFNGYRELHLNAEYKDPSLLRNKLSLDFFQDLGVLSPESKHITVTLNGSFKGIYLQLESVDDLFLNKRGLPQGPIYYAVNNNANFSLIRKEKLKRFLLSGYERKVGNWSDDKYLEEFITVINTTSKKEFPHIITNYINIETYFRWLSGAVCTMNNDGFTHNYALYRNSKSGLFEIIPWDYDATWGRKVNGGIMKYDYLPIEGNKGNYLSHLLLEVPEFRKQYLNILEEVLDVKFTVDYLENKIIELHQELRPYYHLDPYKKDEKNLFVNECEYIFQFINDRNSYLKNQLIKFEK